MSTAPVLDPHIRLRLIYHLLMSCPERAREFRSLLRLYDCRPEQADAEPPEAAFIRRRLNERIRAWIGRQFDELSVVETLEWRAILVEGRFALQTEIN